MLLSEEMWSSLTRCSGFVWGCYIVWIVLFRFFVVGRRSFEVDGSYLIWSVIENEKSIVDFQIMFVYVVLI